MQEIPEPAQTQRNYGVDLLRVTAMCFVVALHTLGHGGVIAAAAPGSVTAHTARFAEALMYGAVDIFALISGYVAMCGPAKRTRLSSWLLLWLETAFYSVGVTLVFCALRPADVPLKRVPPMLFPVRNYIYWYFTAYTGLFVVKPLLNAGMRACSETTAKRIFLAVICAFSAFEICWPHFKIAGGYCFAWITLLYILGAAMRVGRIGERTRPAAALAGIVLLSAFAWAWKTFSEFLPESLRRIELVSYISPAVLGTAICFLVLFSKLRFGKRMRAVIGFAAPGAFAVYLLNTHPDIWSMVLQERFTALAEQPAPLMLAGVIGFALAFTAAALLIDRLRRALEELLHIRAAAEAAEAFVGRCVDWIGERL